MTSTGIVSEFTTGLTNTPRGIVQGGDGYFYVSNQSDNMIDKITVIPAINETSPVTKVTTVPGICPDLAEIIIS